MKKAKVSSITDQEYLPALLKLLSQAKTTIDILSFSFAIGSASGKINTKGAPYQIALKLKEVKKKYGDKIRIRFFTEGFRETVDRNKITAEFLEKAGVEVKYGSTHAKGFCIDGRYVLFGSTNLTNQSITKNHEANLLIEDEKISSEFTHYFIHLWNGGKHGEIELAKPLLADGAFKDAILEMIGKSKKTLEFSIYFFNHPEIEHALIHAHKRGVKVIGFIHEHKAFALPYIRKNKATLKRLRAAGVEELYLGPTNLFSHSKYLLMDRKEVALGTANWLVEDVEIHPQLCIHLKDAPLARNLAEHLENQINSSR
jgi:phosphatidylserine/phosphatidylglycerophosphate/cardiolipin synthase-like enzyme